MAFEFKFPDVGEGIHEGEIVKWRVRVGDEVKEDQPLVEMETAKAIVEAPSPKTGFVLALIGKEGDTVKVGSILAVIGAKGEKWEAASAHESAPGVVGRIPTEEDIALPPRKPESIHSVPAALPSSALKPRFSGPVERVPLKGVRREIAEHMVKSAFTIPHVTHMDEADASALIRLRESKKAEAEKSGVKLTFLPFIIKALVETLKKHLALNAAFDGAAQEIIYKKYYNIGIAVDTPEGLMVPVIKDADKKDALQIAKEIFELAEKCRNKKIQLNELQDGTFSVTNIGSIGGIYATPIIAYGQTGNLGIMRIKEKPVAENGKIVIRPILTLALSYDHRVADGAEAARFMNDLVSLMEK